METVNTLVGDAEGMAQEGGAARLLDAVGEGTAASVVYALAAMVGVLLGCLALEVSAEFPASAQLPLAPPFSSLTRLTPALAVSTSSHALLQPPLLPDFSCIPLLLNPPHAQPPLTLPSVFFLSPSQPQAPQAHLFPLPSLPSLRRALRFHSLSLSTFPFLHVLGSAYFQKSIPSPSPHTCSSHIARARQYTSHNGCMLYTRHHSYGIGTQPT